jgi:electron transport complex protein RnfG
VAADKYIKEQINKNETEKTIKSYNATIDEVIKAKDKSGNDLGYIITVTDNEAYGGSLQMTV